MGLRLPVSIVILAVVLSACGVENAGYSLAGDLRELPFHFPCQRDTRGDKVGHSPATYAPGPMEMLGCITDKEGRGIAGASALPEPEGVATPMTAEGWVPTDEDGRYLVPGVIHPGWYTITASARGYKPVSRRVLYREGHTAVLDLQLDRER